MDPSPLIWWRGDRGIGTLPDGVCTAHTRRCRRNRSMLLLERNGPRRSSIALRSAEGGSGVSPQTGTGKYEQLLTKCKSLKPVPTAVAHPCEASALLGAVEAGDNGLIAPILVAPRAKIEATAKSAGVDLSGFQIVDVPHSHAAATKAVELVRDAQAELLMKGSLHTDELMAAVVASEGGL